MQLPVSTQDPSPGRARGWARAMDVRDRWVGRGRTSDVQDGAALLAAVMAATAHLERHVHEVDALNVFPVPDGDTGTNMLATMRSAVDEAVALPAMERDLERVSAALGLGALVGARGNSGVIMSQILRGAAEVMRGVAHADGHVLAAALRRASEGADAAIASPVEGTLLTVMRDTADAAVMAAERDSGVASVLAASVGAARDSVARTPRLLPILAEAGVVDAGGYGFFLLLEGALASLSGESPHDDGAWPAQPHPAAPAAQSGDTYGYETTLLLRATANPLMVEEVRVHLEAIGGSVGVAGDARLIRIHVHSANPEVVIAYARSLGSVERVSIEDLDRQASEVRAAAIVTGSVSRSKGVAVVAVAQGEGLAGIFEAGGATVVAERRRTPSAGELAAAIRATGHDQVIVLPNDANVRLVAEQAARMVPDASVTVVPTRNAPEGIAALLAIDARGSAQDNARLMLAAARSIQSVALCEAVRDARIGGREVRRGAFIALGAAGDLLAAAADRFDAVAEAMRHLRRPIELLTVYRGASVDPSETDELARRLAEMVEDAEVEVIDGGQPHYRYLIVAE